MSDALDAIEAKGVTVPSGSNSDDLATLIAQISGGGGGVVVTETQDSHGGTIVEITAETVSLQSKSNISPSESSQTIQPDNGYTGLSSVQINAIPSNYVGTGVTQRTSSDLSTLGATVTAPSGYYASAASASISNGSATTPATTVTANPSISVNSTTGVITATASATKSVTPTVSAGYVSSGTAGTITVSGSNTSNLTTQAAQTIHPSTTDQTIASGRYTTGTQTIKAVTMTNLTAANIKSGVTVKVGDSTDDDCVTSVTGTYTGSGGGMNKQIYYGPANVKNNGYTASSATLTVATTGTYKVSWTAWRSSSSGTMGTNLYRNSTAGTNQQTFTGTYGQCITLTNQSYTAGDVLTIYATSGSTSRTIYIANFVIEQTA